MTYLGDIASDMPGRYMGRETYLEEQGGPGGHPHVATVTREHMEECRATHSYGRGRTEIGRPTACLSR